MPVFVRPGRKPRRPIFSRRGSFDNVFSRFVINVIPYVALAPDLELHSVVLVNFWRWTEYAFAHVHLGRLCAGEGGLVYCLEDTADKDHFIFSRTGIDTDTYNTSEINSENVIIMRSCDSLGPCRTKAKVPRRRLAFN